MATAPPTTLPADELRFVHDEAALPCAAANVRHTNSTPPHESAAALQQLLAAEGCQRQLAAANSTPSNPPVPATAEAQRATLDTAPSTLEPANYASSTTLPAAGSPPLQLAIDGERQLAAATHPAATHPASSKRAGACSSPSHPNLSSTPLPPRILSSPSHPNPRMHSAGSTRCPNSSTVHKGGIASGVARTNTCPRSALGASASSSPSSPTCRRGCSRTSSGSTR